MKSLRLSAVAAVLALAACSSATPTDPAANGSRASFDGGPGMVGSGNGTGGSGGGNPIGSGNWTGDSTTDDGSASDPTRSGVGTMGSGG
jgi:hypothetical protein